MTDEYPSPLDLLAASIRADPEAWLDREHHDADDDTSVTGIPSLHEFNEPATEATATDPPHPHSIRAQKTRARYALVAAATVTIAVLGVIVLATHTPSAQAAVFEAATALGDIRTMEGHLVISSPAGIVTSTIRVDGKAFEARTRSTFTDGRVETSEQTVVDGFLYETINGQTTRTPQGPGQQLSAFADASAALIKAVSTDAAIQSLPPDDIDGELVERYDISPENDAVDAIARLDQGQLSWFELEYPDQVDTVSLWVHDGIVRQLEIRTGQSTTRISFENLNGEIDIVAPPGPFTD